MKKQIVAILIVIALITIISAVALAADEEKLWALDIYEWDEAGEYWKEPGSVFGPTICDKATFTMKVVRIGYNFNSDSIPVENASVTFWTETKNTNATGEVTFVTPEIHCDRKWLSMTVAAKDTEGIKYVENGNKTALVVIVEKCRANDSRLVADFSRTDSDGYTTKFDITGKTWRVEWDYSTSSKHPYFSYNLLDTHGHIIQGCSSSDAKYNSHGVVYLEGRGEDFHFQVWDANLWSWSIDVYQED